MKEEQMELNKNQKERDYFKVPKVHRISQKFCWNNEWAFERLGGYPQFSNSQLFYRRITSENVCREEKLMDFQIIKLKNKQKMSLYICKVTFYFCQ